MINDIAIYIGLDVSKEKIAVGLAEAGRTGEVRYYGEIANRADAVRKLAEKLAGRHGRLCFCYEAGPTGYGLYRQLSGLGHECLVVAPSLVPIRPGVQVKTDRRDAVALAALLRAGELSSIWVPDETHEAMRDLCRARETTVSDLRRARQHRLSFLLQHGRVFEGRSHLSKAHRNWLAMQRFDHRAQQIAMEEYIHCIGQIEERRDRLTRQMVELLPNWSLNPVVEAIQALRGVAQIAAVTLVSEIGDLRRFSNPRQFMAWLGLVPKERSTGAIVSRGSITKAGNTRARRMLVEGAWTCRLPARQPGALETDRGIARRNQDNRLEGAGATMPALSADAGKWPPDQHRYRRNCARARRLRVGHRHQSSHPFNKGNLRKSRNRILKGEKSL